MRSARPTTTGESASGRSTTALKSPAPGKRYRTIDSAARMPKIVLAGPAIAVRIRVPFSACTASDWTDGGWTADDSVALAIRLKASGVDLIDCSTGGNVARATIPLGPGYQ